MRAQSDGDDDDDDTDHIMWSHAGYMRIFGDRKFESRMRLKQNAPTHLFSVKDTLCPYHNA